ncbi:hypothetical protein [Microbulbifer guangxiensis]|uniref:hypothetical protein n=1 Tax=Microbulbifer guangxiensis TaxID=2904249 RepID=UPI001F3ADB70|nr:hypothetical protein [Microbulbifer guangxiensis]
MKKLLLGTLLLSAFVQAEEERVSVYLQFEEAYMSNDVTKFSPWLSESYRISQTLHVPGMGSDTRSVSKNQLLASMKAVGKPSSLPRSKSEDTTIESSDETSFCGSTSTIGKTVVGGKNYEEKEVRKVCFQKQGTEYKATSHNIDVHYRAL